MSYVSGLRAQGSIRVKNNEYCFRQLRMGLEQESTQRNTKSPSKTPSQYSKSRS